MRAGLAMTMVALAACGALHGSSEEDAPVDVPDAAADARTEGDAAAHPDEGAETGKDAPSGRCEANQPFGPAVAIGELAGATSARASGDGASIVASIPQGAEADVVEGAAGAALATFTGIITGTSVDTIPSPCGSGLCIFWEHADTAGAKTEIWSATRMSAGGALNGSAAITLPIPSIAKVHEPWVVAEGDVFYFTYDDGSAVDIYRSSKTGTTYDANPVPGIASGLPETSAVLTDDERTIYFARRAGDDDVYVATRPDPSSSFTGAVRVDAASVASKNDRPTWVSTDGCVLWISSDRDGTQKIYRLEKQR